MQENTNSNLDWLERKLLREIYLKKIRTQKEEKPIRKSRSKYSLVGDPCLTIPGFFDFYRKNLKRKYTETVDTTEDLPQEPAPKRDPNTIFVVVSKDKNDVSKQLITSSYSEVKNFLGVETVPVLEADDSVHTVSKEKDISIQKAHKLPCSVSSTQLFDKSFQPKASFFNETSESDIAQDLIEKSSQLMSDISNSSNFKHPNQKDSSQIATTMSVSLINPSSSKPTPNLATHFKPKSETQPKSQLILSSPSTQESITSPIKVSNSSDPIEKAPSFKFPPPKIKRTKISTDENIKSISDSPQLNLELTSPFSPIFPLSIDDTDDKNNEMKLHTGFHQQQAKVNTPNDVYSPCATLTPPPDKISEKILLQSVDVYSVSNDLSHSAPKISSQSLTTTVQSTDEQNVLKQNTPEIFSTDKHSGNETPVFLASPVTDNSKEFQPKLPESTLSTDVSNFSRKTSEPLSRSEDAQPSFTFVPFESKNQNSIFSFSTQPPGPIITSQENRSLNTTEAPLSNFQTKTPTNFADSSSSINTIFQGLAASKFSSSNITQDNKVSSSFPTNKPESIIPFTPKNAEISDSSNFNKLFNGDTNSLPQTSKPFQLPEPNFSLFKTEQSQAIQSLTLTEPLTAPSISEPRESFTQPLEPQKSSNQNSSLFNNDFQNNIFTLPTDRAIFQNPESQSSNNSAFPPNTSLFPVSLSSSSNLFSISTNSSQDKILFPPIFSSPTTSTLDLKNTTTFGSSKGNIFGNQPSISSPSFLTNGVPQATSSNKLPLQNLFGTNTHSMFEASRTLEPNSVQFSQSSSNQINKTSIFGSEAPFATSASFSQNNIEMPLSQPFPSPNLFQPAVSIQPEISNPSQLFSVENSSPFMPPTNPIFSITSSSFSNMNSAPLSGFSSVGMFNLPSSKEPIVATPFNGGFAHSFNQTNPFAAEGMPNNFSSPGTNIIGVMPSTASSNLNSNMAFPQFQQNTCQQQSQYAPSMDSQPFPNTQTSFSMEPSIIFTQPISAETPNPFDFKNTEQANPSFNFSTPSTSTTLQHRKILKARRNLKR